MLLSSPGIIPHNTPAINAPAENSIPVSIRLSIRCGRMLARVAPASPGASSRSPVGTRAHNTPYRNTPRPLKNASSTKAVRNQTTGNRRCAAIPLATPAIAFCERSRCSCGGSFMVEGSEVMTLKD